METKIPASKEALSYLLRADFTTQWRNRRSVILVLLVPVIILISWKGLIEKFGGAFALSNCITVGLTAIGLMGYSNAIGRDREKGVFQRLRVAPVPSWYIMASRLIVQMAMILLLTVVTFIVGHNYDKIILSPAGYALTLLTALIGGALYLGLGQMIVGLVKNAETVNSTTRLIYFIFIMVGMFGQFIDQLKDIVKWSPYGTVKTILAASMQPAKWDAQASVALVVTILYAAVFSFLGLKWFKWNIQ